MVSASLGDGYSSVDGATYCNGSVFTGCAAFLNAGSVLVGRSRSMDWSSCATSGFVFFVLTIFNNWRSYALRRAVGLDGVTDGALEGCIFFGFSAFGAFLRH
jgi:hypothetical protein